MDKKLEATHPDFNEITRRQKELIDEADREQARRERQTNENTNRLEAAREKDRLARMVVRSDGGDGS
jgi:hypothetical protein